MKTNIAPSKALMYLLSILLSAVFLPPSVFGQINYSDFNSGTDNLNFVENASVNAGKIRINTDFFTRGAAWYKTPQSVKNGFVCMFSFRISNPTILPDLPPDYQVQNGADGFAFVIQGAGINAIGNAGGQMGYGTDLDDDPIGIEKSLIVEFDTYKNDVLNDPDANHISVHNNGQSPSKADESVTSLAIATSSTLGFSLKDGNEHTVRIEYDGTTMTIYVDNFTTPKITVPINFDTILGSTSNATIGFTGGSGAENENHDITSWSFSPYNAMPSYDKGTAPNADDTTALTFSSSDYHPDSNPADNSVITLRTDTAVIPDRATELWAKYYFPSSMTGGPYPLVILLHGNHDTCGYFVTPNIRFDNQKQYTTIGKCIPVSGNNYVVTPNHRGYDYLAGKLASRGYIVASINANLGINAGGSYLKASNADFPEYTDDLALILARGRLVLRHLQKLSEWNNGVKALVTVNTYGSEKNNFTGLVGMKVTVGSQPIKVRSIGRMYLRGNNSVHALKIIRASDNVSVASTSVTATGWNHKQFKYANLTSPVTLDANTSYYIVSDEKKNQDKWYDSTSNVTSSSEVTINNGVQSANGTTWTNPGGVQPLGPVDIIYEPLSNKSFITNVTAGLEKNDVSGRIGMKVTTGSKPIKLLSLGRMAVTGNTQSHALNVVRASDNTIVATATVGMSGATTGSFKYATLPSAVTLAANTQYYVVSQETSGGDKWLDSTTVIIANNVAVVNSAVTNVSGAVWTESGSTGQTFGPVDFIYEEPVSTTPSALGVDLKGKIDFGNVGLMGHSRGGEGVRAAYELYKETGSLWNQRILDSAALNNGFKGVFEIAPTDRSIINMSGVVLRELNAVGTAWSVLLPACDSDLHNLRGVKPFDRMSKLSVESPARFKSTYFVYGANHNGFNSQWHFSDSWGDTSPYTGTYPGGDGCIGKDNSALYLSPTATAGEDHVNILPQQNIASSAFLAFIRGNVGSAAQSSFNQNFDPSYNIPMNVSAITKIERGYLLSPDSSQTLKFNSLEFAASTANLCGGSGVPFSCSEVDASKIEVLSSTIQPRSDTRPEINHDENFRSAIINWRSPSPKRYFQAKAPGASSNISSYQTLDFRISRRRNASDRLTVDSLNSTDSTNFSIQLVMADGSVSTVVSLSKYLQLKGPVGTKDRVSEPDTGGPKGELHPILNTVRIPLSDFSGANLAQVAGVRFIFNDTKTGAVFLSSIVASK